MYRPYLSPDRARHQLARHEHYVDVPRLALSPIAARTMAGIVAAFRIRPRLALAVAPSDPGSSR